MRACLAVLAALLLPGVAAAQEREMCVGRPGLGRPACTVAPGHVLIETGLGDWTREDDEDGRVDTIRIGETLARIGIAHSAEFQINWTPYGHERERDATGAITRTARVGDVRLGVRRNLSNPDGHGFAIAVTPFVQLPVGRTPIGAGDWGGGLIVPVTYDLTDAVQVEFTSEVEAAVDKDGHGRHLSHNEVAGFLWNVTKRFGLVGEMQAIRDRDPAKPSVQYLASAGVAWRQSDHVQFDIGTVAGLNHDAPDWRAYGGIAALF